MVDPIEILEELIQCHVDQDRKFPQSTRGWGQILWDIEKLVLPQLRKEQQAQWRKPEPIEFAEQDGTVRKLVWEKGDDSVGVPSGYVAETDWAEHFAPAEPQGSPPEGASGAWSDLEYIGQMGKPPGQVASAPKREKCGACGSLKTSILGKDKRVGKTCGNEDCKLHLTVIDWPAKAPTPGEVASGPRLSTLEAAALLGKAIAREVQGDAGSSPAPPTA